MTTAIIMPLTGKDEKEMAESRKIMGRTFWAVAELISMLTLLVMAGFVLYETVTNIAPSCDKSTTHPRDHDFGFKTFGNLDDDDFEEDYHYDHKSNVLVEKITSQGSKENATALHDFDRGLTTYVIPSQQRCFLGELESDSYDMLSHATNGGVMELSSPVNHHYLSQGIISPPFLERAASPMVTNHCSGMETSWIEPSIEGASVQRRQAEHSSRPVIRTADGTVFIISGGLTAEN